MKEWLQIASAYYRRSRSEGGAVAIALMLAFMTIGVPVTISAAQLAGQYSSTSRVYDERLEGEHCVGSGVEHAIWRLAYEPGFADQMTTENPTLNYSITQCGFTITVDMLRQTIASAGSGGLAIGSVDYQIEAGHQLEIFVTVDQTSQNNMWLSYDTVNEPSWVNLPSTADGDLTFILHNNPSPPFGDTFSQHPLLADINPPTATTLYNYDLDRDNYPGMLLKKSDDGVNETHPDKYQEWQTAPFTEPFHITGSPTANLWFAVKGFKTDKTGVINLFLRDKNGTIYTEIVSTQVIMEPEVWVEGEFTTFLELDIYDIEVASATSVTRARVMLDEFGDPVLISKQIF